MGKQFIIRHGYIEHVWRYRFEINGFETFVLIRGTEPEMRDYINEIPYDNGYITALRDDEIKAAKTMGMKIYCAPEIVPEFPGNC